jgi:3-oxoacyl-[acyl-carrier-protein] synthase II
MSRRVVITGLGLVSPLGNSADRLWEALSTGTSGVRELTSIPTGGLHSRFGAEARDFTGSIEDFGPLEKTQARNIKKNLKVMCREIQMGVAVSQLAIADAGLKLDTLDLTRIGVLFGSDYMLTLPQEFTAGMSKCRDAAGNFDFNLWAERGLPEVEPLWLLKYLPNLPACHVAIFNDLRGPNNSITMREASPNLAIAEAFCTIERGHADLMIAGATGTRVHIGRTLHITLEEEIASDDGQSAPAALSRPFEKNRRGQVIGEGAGALMLEELEFARARGAKILGEVIGFASSQVIDRQGVGQLRQAARNVLVQALRSAKLTPEKIGHIHAHGLSTTKSDADEAQAIHDVFGSVKVPVTAAKSYFGNLGAGSGLVETIASLLAVQKQELFPLLNYDVADPDCPIHATRPGQQTPAGDNFINLNISPVGQASAVVIRGFAD